MRPKWFIELFQDGIFTAEKESALERPQSDIDRLAVEIGMREKDLEYAKLQIRMQQRELEHLRIEMREHLASS